MFGRLITIYWKMSKKKFEEQNPVVHRSLRISVYPRTNNYTSQYLTQFDMLHSIHLNIYMHVTFIILYFNSACTLFRDLGTILMFILKNKNV